jgi:hypothetical protein
MMSSFIPAFSSAVCHYLANSSRINGEMISQTDAVKKFQDVIPRVDPHLELDVGAVRFVSEPYPGVEFGLRLGDAGALLFVSEADLTTPDWQARLHKRLEAAKRYLEEFPHARRAGAAGM